MPYVPNLARTLREGYGVADLRADAVAGLTVAIVALPLSMAIAIAAGATPAMGLITAIVGGFLVSLLGGSRYQIGGPAGAFIVLVAGVIQSQGIEVLVLATFLSGLMLAALGWLRLGGYIQLVPFPVTVGFTAGIASIIFASQIRPLLGLDLPGPEPAPLIEKLPALWAALPTINFASLGLAAGAIALMLALKRFRPNWPRMLIAVVAAGAAALALNLPVDTIGSVFGALPARLPAPTLPSFDLSMLAAAAPPAVAFTLLGAIESLLSAVVADGMSGERHNPNAELVAQGAANVGAALFGGFCVTGTIARTATNVRAGARSPIAGMLHALFLLLFLLIAAPLAAYIPLAALAAVLALVAWDMVEKPAIAALTRASRGDAVVLYVTLALTVLRDLTEAIVVGVALGAVLFIHRMAAGVEVHASGAAAPDAARDGGTDEAVHPEATVFHIRGAMFFGAVSAVAAVLDRLGAARPLLVIDCSDVTLVDSSAAHMIEGIARRAKRRGTSVYLTGARLELRRTFLAHGARPPLVRYAATIDAALQAARRRGEIERDAGRR